MENWFVYFNKSLKKLVILTSETKDESLVPMMNGNDLGLVLQFCVGFVVCAKNFNCDVNNTIEEFALKLPGITKVWN